MLIGVSTTAGVAVSAPWLGHFELHVGQTTLRDRIENDTDLGPSPFRFAYMQPYAEAARTWLAWFSDRISEAVKLLGGLRDQHVQTALGGAFHQTVSCREGVRDGEVPIRGNTGTCDRQRLIRSRAGR